MIQNIIDRAMHYAWSTEISEFEMLGAMPTMLSIHEKRMLHWLARELFLNDDSCIVDAGCFLGGSTMALASGLSKNPYLTQKECLIHTYDMFVTPRDQCSIELIGGTKTPGESFLDLFVDFLGNYKQYVMVHAGNFCCAPAPYKTIDLLFVDICKNWDLNDVVIDRFFPKMIPGRSFLIQQDYNDHSCPWVNLTMAYYKEYFMHLATVNGSNLYLYTKQIPLPQMHGSILRSLTPDEQLQLMRREIEESPNEICRFFNAVTTGWLIFLNQGLPAAEAYYAKLDEIAKQPWESDTPYLDNALSAMRSLQDTQGFSEYHHKFFSK